MKENEIKIEHEGSCGNKAYGYFLNHFSRIGKVYQNYTVHQLKKNEKETKFNLYSTYLKNLKFYLKREIDYIILI